MAQWFDPKPILKYMERHGMTQSDFARLLGVSTAAVSQWMTGVKPMGLRTAANVEKATKREVKVRDLFPKFFERAA